jgi:trehalose 6-phosphate phosphatase
VAKQTKGAGAWRAPHASDRGRRYAQCHVCLAILEGVSADETGDGMAYPLLESIRANPARAAILTDVDGTLAPIVDRPELAAVPAEVTALLSELSERFALVGCISGRQASEARRLVGVDGIAYAGNHGFELLLPGEREPRLDPSVAGRERDAADFLYALDDGGLATAGLRVENKGPIQALHWRGAADERGAEARAHEIATEAGRAELEPRWGRKVLELRPVGGGGKDAAVAALLAADGVTAAIYAGDDRTDLDAFRRLRELRDEDDLTAAVCVGVISPEAPPGLAEEADLLVDGPPGWLAMLEALAA